LYEGLKQNSTIVIVPSSAVETMQLGGLAGLTALTMGIGQDGKPTVPQPVEPAPFVPANGGAQTNGYGVADGLSTVLASES
jgi:hypothetical protein